MATKEATLLQIRTLQNLALILLELPFMLKLIGPTEKKQTM